MSQLVPAGSGDFCNDSSERCGGGISRQDEADFFSLNVRPKRQSRTVLLRQRGRRREGEGEGFVANVIWVSFLFF